MHVSPERTNFTLNDQTKEEGKKGTLKERCLVMGLPFRATALCHHGTNGAESGCVALAEADVRPLEGLGGCWLRGIG